MKALTSIEPQRNVSVILAELTTDGDWSGITESGTLGATIAFGELVYFKSADSKWYKADSSDATKSGDVKLSICIVAGINNEPSVFLLFGKVRADSLFPTLTPTSPVFISTTPGSITHTPTSTTDYVNRRIGYGNSANELYFNPSNDYFTYL